MAVSIRIDVDAKALQGGLKALRDAGGDMRDTWDAIGRRWVDLTRERFETGTAPDGTTWKPSARAKRDSGQTLVDTRRLQDSITHEPDDRGVTIGTNTIYAAIHQFGGTIVPKTKKALRFFIPGAGWITTRKVTMPPRPFLGANDGDLEEFAAILSNRLRRAVAIGAVYGGGNDQAPEDQGSGGVA